MASAISEISHLTSPLASIEQLTISTSRQGGVPQDIEDAIKYRASCTLQAVGILLRLPQTLVAETIVIFHRFWLGSQGGSLLVHSAKDVAAACLYLVTKPGPYPLSPRQILDSLFYVIHVPDNVSKKRRDEVLPIYTEAQFEVDRAALIRTESEILRVLGYDLHVALPHAICISYLQSLDALDAQSGQDLASRACAHLNSALLSPQLLYLTHQPNALAVAAVYLAARECNADLPDGQWWEVFDVDREELGFLVVALTSMSGFVEEQKKHTPESPPLLSVQALKEYLAHRSELTPR